MKYSVVIPTYNRPGLAENLSKSIHLYNPDAEVIVVDQTDEISPNTSVAKNTGIHKSNGEVIIFFDDDVEITPKTIESHLSEYQDQEVVGVAGRVINDGELVPQDTQVTTGQMNKLGTNFVKNFWGERRQSVVHPYGCNMSFRMSVLEKIGGFDTKFPPPLSAFEEIDLGLRATKIGKIIFSPSALVYHHRAGSGGTRINQADRNKLYYESYGRLVRKHVNFPSIIISVFILIFRISKESPKCLSNFIKGLTSI